MTALVSTQRMFFALWPDPVTGKLLQQAGKKLHGACGGHITRLETIHMTLVFLGNVEVARLDELQSIAGEINAAPFLLDISSSGWWQHNRIGWVAPETTAPALSELVTQLSAKLTAAGFELDTRKYVPHVTLLRKSECQVTMPPIDTIQWYVSEFVLVMSGLSNAGAAYEIVGRWPLQETVK